MKFNYINSCNGRKAQIVVILYNYWTYPCFHGFGAFTHFFMYKGHRCLVFEQLHYNLFDILRFNNFVGFNIHHVQRIAYQLFCALRYIHSDCNKIIHCDVKPENILLSAFEGSDIKLIDFGSSSHMGSCFFSYIQSRYYRAPEVILGLPYTSSIDMWSVACVLYEICTGEPLFRGRNELEQLILISSLLGDPPMSMLIKGKKVEDFYLRTRVRDDGNSRYIRRVSSQHIPESMYHSPQSLLSRADVSSEDYELYYELVQLLWELLCWDSSKRLTAEQALNSRFFKVGSIASSLTSNQSPVLVQAQQPLSSPERSCESLSSFFQQNNLPRPTLSPGPKLHHPKETTSPQTEEEHVPLSNDSALHNSLVHKHKRLHSAPICRLESEAGISNVPIASDGSGSSPRPVSEANTLLLSHSDSARVIETPNFVPSKILTPEDYRTPPLIMKSVQEGQLSRPPFMCSPKLRTPPVSVSQSGIVHPPLFEDIHRTTPSPEGILSPQSIPLCKEYLPVGLPKNSSILSPLVARSGVDRTIGHIQEGRTRERNLSTIFLPSPQIQSSFNPTLSH